MRHSLRRTLMAGAVIATLLVPCLALGEARTTDDARQQARATHSQGVAKALAAGTMWTQFWDVRVRRAPNGPVLTLLDRNQRVRVTGTHTLPDGTTWSRVR